MNSHFERTALLRGEEAIRTLSAKKVAVFGLGGVGSWCCEALGRSGVGSLALIDHDTVSESNLNRQLVALHSTLGQPKVSVMAARLRDINPAVSVTEYPVFYLPENADAIDISLFDCIVDAIDTVTAKLHLIQTAKALGVPIISSMGTGNKLRPDRLVATDISKTDTCPLARVMRRELRAAGISHLRVVYSTEIPLTPRSRGPAPAPGQPRGKETPGSSPWVPSSAGLLIASEVVAKLLGQADW